MFKLIIKYAVSTGFQRATIFLASLLLMRVYSPSEVGEYILMQTVAQFAIPLITLNVTVALTREALQNIWPASRTLGLVMCVCCFIFFTTTLLGFLDSKVRWFFVGASLGVAESAYASMLAFFIGREKANKVLFLSLARTVFFGGVILLAYLRYISVIELTRLMSVFIMFLSSVYVGLIVFRVSKLKRLAHASSVSISSMYKYSVATLPHTAALWLSVSADRLILGAVEGKNAVAQYAISYTVAQTVLVVVAGIISAVPPRVSADIAYWSDKKNITSFFNRVAFVCLMVSIGNIFVTFLNFRVFKFVPNAKLGDLFIVSIISFAFFLSMFYVYFASYLYQQRDTKALSVFGFFLGPVNALIYFVLVNLLGSLGAAIGLAFCYLSFAMAYGWAAITLVPQLRAIVRFLILLAGGFLVTLLSISAVIYILSCTECA